MALKADLPRLLKAGLKKSGVPGASLAVLHNGKLHSAAAGILNVDTRVPVTDDSTFQIGSITKIFTTTLIMQQVQAGRLDLDAPVTDVLPTFSIGDKRALKKITPRHFLTHTSGVDGDFFADAGRGDDSVARMMDMAAMLPQVFAPGAKHSYCNIGFAALGRMLEVLHGASWDTVLKRELFRPLGMRHAFTLPEEAVRYRTAIGHVDDPKTGKPRQTPTPWLAHGQKAAGATPTMSVLDLMKFAAAHLAGGKAENGKRILGARGIKAMQKPQVKLPQPAPRGITAWGLGWMLSQWHGKNGSERVIGHDGGTVGQYAFLRIFPERNVAIALLTNGNDAQALYEHTFDAIADDLLGVREPRLPEPDPDLQVDFDRYTGQYENIATGVTIRRRKGKLLLDVYDATGRFGTQVKAAPVAFIDPETITLRTGNRMIDRSFYRFSELGPGGYKFACGGLRQLRRVG